MKDQPTRAHPRFLMRSAVSAAIAAGAISATLLLSSVMGAIERSQAAEDTLARVDRETAELHGAIRTRIEAGEPIGNEIDRGGEGLDSALDAVRTASTSVTPFRLATVMPAITTRLSRRLTAALDVDIIARARQAYAAEAARAAEAIVSAGTPDAGRPLELRFLMLKQAIGDLQRAASERAASLLSVLDITMHLLIGLGALAFGYVLWRPETRRPETTPAPAATPLPAIEPVAIVDRHGIIQHTEGSVDRIFGQAKDVLRGANILALVHPGDQSGVERFLVQCSNDPKTAEPIEFRPKHHGGAWFAMEAASGRRKSDPRGTTSIIRFVDVTSRKKAEEALRQSTDLVQTLIEASPLAIIIEDQGGRVRLWNSAAARVFGWTADQVLGHTNPTVPVDAGEEHRNLRQRIMDGQAFTGLESQRVTSDGTTLEVSITTAPLKRSDGQGGDVMEVIADITSRKELEAQLRQAQKMEGIGRLAGGIAHDFNNLLTAIVGHADMLLKSPGLSAIPAGSDGQQQSMIRFEIDQIHQAGERAAALTQQLLAFSRSQVMQPTILNLNSAVTDMEQMLRRLIGEDIDLAFVPEGSLDSIKADPTQVGQVIMNLALNARDAMPTGGRLTVETANVELDEIYSRKHVPVIPGSYVMLAVSDTGVGMDKETQAKVFEPFFTTKEKGRGTGLGLATVYGIVRQSGGYIWVYSEPAHGTSFKVYFPSAAVRSEVEQQPDRPSQPPPSGSETVLLVEDEEMVRTLVRQVLTWYGYNVLEAHNGEAALKVAKEYAGAIDLMLTDIVMPGMSALDLVKHFSAVRPQAKVIYMSGYTDHAVVRNNLLNAGRAFLQKPFAPDRLAHKIREVLSQEQEAPRQASDSESDYGGARVLPFAG